jgi:hypothetical protein
MIVTIQRDGQLIGQTELKTALDIHGIAPSVEEGASTLTDSAWIYAIQEVLCDLWPYTCADDAVLEMVQ